MVMVAVEEEVETSKKMDSHSSIKSVMLVVEEAVAVLVFLLVLVLMVDLEMVVLTHLVVMVVLDLSKQVESKVEQVAMEEIMQEKQ